MFGTSGNVDPATGSVSGAFEPSTDSCVLIGASAGRTAPAELLAGNGATPAGFHQPAVPGAPATNAGESWTNSLGMEFVWIPDGTFLMGSPEGGRDRERQHGVRISQGFWMGKYEVTQGEWESVMGENPSAFSECGARCPVDTVSWYDAQWFIGRLNERETGRGNRYRLPTEAEWEYAARAGTTGARYGELDEIAWYSENSGRTTHPVGQKRANAWGLHDMLGNVYEFTADWYRSYPGADHEVRNGRVIRGGGWGNSARDVRSAVRYSYSPGRRSNSLGFRLVRTE